MSKKKTNIPPPEGFEQEVAQAQDWIDEQGPAITGPGDDPLAAPTAETGESEPPAAASSEEPSPAIDPSQVRQLNRDGHCGHCGNPHVAKYGEGKWKCVCGAGNL